MEQPRPVDLAQLLLNPSPLLLRDDGQIETASECKQAAHHLLRHRNRLHAAGVGDDDAAARELLEREQVGNGRGGRMNPAQPRRRSKDRRCEPGTQRRVGVNDVASRLVGVGRVKDRRVG